MTAPGGVTGVLVALSGETVATAVAALRDVPHRVHAPGAAIDLTGLEAVVTGVTGVDAPLVDAIVRAGDDRPALVLVAEPGERPDPRLPRPDEVVAPGDVAATLGTRVRSTVAVWRANARARREASRARGVEDLLSGLVGALQDGMAIVDRQGVLVEVNDRLCAMTGFRRADLIGASEPLPYWPEEQLDQLRGLVEDVVRGAPPRESEVVLRRSDGGRFPAVVTSSPLVGPRGGAPVGRVTVVRDLTPRRAVEDEQESLRRIATRVAEGATPDRIFSLVAQETAGLLGCDSAIVVRYVDTVATVVGTHGDHSELGEVLPATGDGVLARVARDRRPARIDDYRTLPEDSALRTHALRTGYHASAAAPVMVNGALWGAVLVTTRSAGVLGPGSGDRLGRFAELVGLAVDNAQSRSELRRLAATDPLTLLANRRAFEERMGQEVSRARRHGRSLSLVVVDLDHFKRVNDAHGHPVGDAVLVEFAERLRRNARPEDFVARMGGEEFAWLMPECSAIEAVAAAERLRQRVARAPFAEGITVTLSAGVCDLVDADGAAALYRLADEALYWAKGNGRNRVWRYSVAMASEEDTADDQAQRAERYHTLRAVRALARAVDAKDPATLRHSERVSDLAVRLAEQLGWPPERVGALGEAALIHDVGKIGVRDAVLLKPGALTPEERREVGAHADLGAQIAEEIVSAEQAAWIRHHHERWEGGGYPQGLAGHDIPAGALIIAIADAVDVMCSPRVYAPARTLQEALQECRDERGRQFAPWAVDALQQLAARGDLRAGTPPAPAVSDAG